MQPGCGLKGRNKQAQQPAKHLCLLCLRSHTLQPAYEWRLQQLTRIPFALHIRIIGLESCIERGRRMAGKAHLASADADKAAVPLKPAMPHSAASRCTAPSRSLTARSLASAAALRDASVLRSLSHCCFRPPATCSPCCTYTPHTHHPYRPGTQPPYTLNGAQGGLSLHVPVALLPQAPGHLLVLLHAHITITMQPCQVTTYSAFWTVLRQQLR